MNSNDCGNHWLTMEIHDAKTGAVERVKVCGECGKGPENHTKTLEAFLQ